MNVGIFIVGWHVTSLNYAWNLLGFSRTASLYVEQHVGNLQDDHTGAIEVMRVHPCLPTQSSIAFWCVICRRLLQICADSQRRCQTVSDRCCIGSRFTRAAAACKRVFFGFLFRWQLRLCAFRAETFFGRHTRDKVSYLERCIVSVAVSLMRSIGWKINARMRRWSY